MSNNFKNVTYSTLSLFIKSYVAFLKAMNSSTLKIVQDVKEGHVKNGLFGPQYRDLFMVLQEVHYEDLEVL